MAGIATFPPEARLRSAADFAALRRCRKPLRGRFFIVRHVSGALPGARLGMAVSRKVSKRAVDRNRIKRCARESFRQQRERFPACDVLLIALPAAAAAEPAQLREELTRHWQRLAAIHAAPPGPPDSFNRTGAPHLDRNPKPT